MTQTQATVKSLPTHSNLVKYRDKINSLAAKHSLEFQYNSGGAEFIHKQYGGCQICMMGNYRDDYERLFEWLKKNGLEQ